MGYFFVMMMESQAAIQKFYKAVSVLGHMGINFRLNLIRIFKF